jgi:hypothetical protein
MEKLVNCPIVLDIDSIDNITGANQLYEIMISTKSKEKYKFVFDFVWDIRISIENGYIDRFSKFIRSAKQASSILLVENSEYIKYFENQISGTLPVDRLKNYILFDVIDTVIEVLTVKEPTLIKMN